MSVSVTQMVLISQSVAVQILRKQHIREFFSSLLQLFSKIPAVYHKITQPQNPEEAENVVYPFCTKMVSGKLSMGGLTWPKNTVRSRD